MRLLAAAFAMLVLGLSASATHAEEAAGDWSGVLAGELHVIVHITKEGGGRYAVTLESPDQGSFILRADKVEVEADHLAFNLPDIEARYDGAWKPEQGAWVGAWTQAQTLPLSLSRRGASGAR